MGAEGNFAAEAAVIGGEPRRRASSLRSLLEELGCFGGEALSKYGEEIHSGHLRPGTYRPQMDIGLSKAGPAGVDQHSLYQELGQDAFDGHDRAALGNIEVAKAPPSFPPRLTGQVSSHCFSCQDSAA